MIISILPEIKDKVNVVLGTFTCDVINTTFNQSLWDEIHAYIQAEIKQLQVADIKTLHTISNTRNAYKSLGKDPNRYRPSAESLRRRLVRGFDLYQVSTLVDIINFVSLKTGFSIGAFDAAKIEGDLTYGVGKANESYTAIGRGELNIENLPVLSDNTGGIGTPTSDEIRTAISLNTTKLFVNINCYNNTNILSDTIDFSIDLLKKYSQGTNFNLNIIS